MIDIYERSGDPGQRLLVRERQPLPDFADAAEWSHVGTRATVNAELGSILQNQGYAQVQGRADQPLETDWESVFGGSAETPAASPSAAGSGGGQPASAGGQAGGRSEAPGGENAGQRSGSSESGQGGSGQAGSRQGASQQPASGEDDQAASAIAPVVARATAAVRAGGLPAVEAIERRVREQPVQTLLITLGVGFLLGLLP